MSSEDWKLLLLGIIILIDTVIILRHEMNDRNVDDFEDL